MQLHTPLAVCTYYILVLTRYHDGFTNVIPNPAEPLVTALCHCVDCQKVCSKPVCQDIGLSLSYAFSIEVREAWNNREI